MNWPTALRLPAIVAALTALGVLLSASVAQGASVSANWAGYVALPTSSIGPAFSSVSGTWQQPRATCSAGHATYSAVWVGLGGYNAGARALEQVGADADCSRSGGAIYTAWYELLPAAPVNLKMTVRPGDEISASVTVHAHGVTMRVRDLSSGARFTITRHASSIDTSSADWIVEAPSVCVGSNSCQPLALTDFGEASFASATAAADGHTGTILDPDWSLAELEIQQSAFTRFAGATAPQTAPSGTLILATPSAPSGSTGAFSVTWQEKAPQVERPSSGTLPGFGGGPP